MAIKKSGYYAFTPDDLETFAMAGNGADAWNRADTVAASTATAATVTAGSSVAGTINGAGDHDWYRVTFYAGSTYQVRVMGADSGNGTLADPFLVVRNSAGAHLTANDNSGVGHDADINFTPMASATYYLDASAFGTGTGSFRVAVATAREISGSTATAATMLPGQSYYGRVSASGDHDWYRVTLTAGHTYSFEMQGADTGAGTLADPYLRLRNAAGTSVDADNNSGVGLNSAFTYTPTTSGTYFIDTGAANTGSGTFRVSYRDTDVAASTASTATIAVNGSQLGAIEWAGDRDWYAVNLVAGTTYNIEEASNSSLRPGLSDTYLRGIYTSSGALISGTTNDDADYSTYNSLVTFTPTTTGRYFIAAGGYGTLTGGYRLSVTTANVTDEIGATTDTAGTIALGATGVSGSIDSPRDIDWYSVALTAGTTYIIDERGTATGNGTLTDPYFIGVYDAAGVLIPGTGNDDFGGNTNSQVTFTPQTSGIYYLAAGGYFNYTGTYQLTINAGAPSTDIPASTLSAAVVTVGSSFAGDIEIAADVDWIGVTLTEGQAYQVDLTGAASTGGTLADPYIHGIYSSTGSVVAGTADNDSGTGTDAQVVFTAPTTGTYYIAAGATGSGTGSYTVAVQTTVDSSAPIRLATNPADNATGIAVGQNLTLTFNEAIRAGTGNFVLSNGTSTIQISVTDTSQVSISGQTVTLNPTADLAPGTTYSVTYAAGVIEDLAGNDVAALTSATDWTFTTASAGTTPTDTWTLIVYIAGDNNLESFALSDLNEMEMVNLPSTCNVVVLADRAPGYSTASGNWTDARHGQIVYDGTNSTVTSLSNASTSIGEVNMGSAATLTTFINWAAANNPAQNYGLVLWDHGSGIAGSCWDDSSAGDHLTYSEVRSAIGASTVDHFGFIGFDACLMAMTEQAFDLQAYTDVLVASQELEPGNGWDYDVFLNALRLNPNMSAEQLASNIVSSYAPQYAGQADITLSATRLSGLAVLETNLDSFVARALQLSTASADWTAMRTAAAQCRPMPSDGSETYADLGQFMHEVSVRVADSTLRTAATAVETALDAAVFAETGSVGEASGLSIYLPYGSDVVSSTYTAANFSFLARVDWDDFLARL